jgi:hypothetical protein
LKDPGLFRVNKAKKTLFLKIYEEPLKGVKRTLKYISILAELSNKYLPLHELIIGKGTFETIKTFCKREFNIFINVYQ